MTGIINWEQKFTSRSTIYILFKNLRKNYDEVMKTNWAIQLNTVDSKLLPYL